MNKKDKTRELILQKSYYLFAEKGFNKITMKDICDETGLSRGGLYSHFSSTKEIFEATIENLNEKEEMDFHRLIKDGISATEILNGALNLMEKEMKESQDSLSLAIYEYSGTVEKDLMNRFTKAGIKKWTELLEYGIKTKEFKSVDVFEITNMILYVYQGVRMWSRIVDIKQNTFRAIINNIKKQLLEELQ